MSKAKLSKHLQELDKEEVIAVLMELYDSHKEVKSYFKYYLNPNENERFEHFKKKIAKEFNLEAKKAKKRISVVKKAIADFERLKPTESLIAELMIYFIETGLRYSQSKRYMNQQYLERMLSHYDNALNYMYTVGLLDVFKFRAGMCVRNAEYCDRELHDVMQDVYRKYYHADA